MYHSLIIPLYCRILTGQSTHTKKKINEMQISPRTPRPFESHKQRHLFSWLNIYMISHPYILISLPLPSYDSETVDSFHKNLTMTGARLAPIASSPGPKQSEESPSAVARKMIEDERDSAVFRQGDYNVTRKYPN